ncbi:MAG: pectate lyase [Anaerolineae bacterium]|nr:pectate lyase [Anaerolineae bacterium]
MMRVLKLTLVLACLLAVITAVLPTHADPRDLGRETLALNDGWAAEGAGTTGGAAATADQVYVVTNRQELVAALNNGVYPPPSNPSDVPKIIYVSGVIDANVDDNNQPLVCEDYYRDGYTLDAFLATYDPAVWGRTPPSGPLEDARLVSRNAQQARVRIRVGSNTTIVGMDKDATIRGAWLDLRGTTSVNRTNIIIRNLNFEDTYDCFPAWSPTDGALGSWNALYDSISLRNTDHVWIDHNRFEDVTTADHLLPHYLGVLYQVHDGLVDITNASDFVTVSWNRLLNHDKVMLIGSSDGAIADRGKLRVTLHHNLFASTGQRTPRVRFGQVHVYNNVYKIGGHVPHVYNWGVGIESAIYAENNLFTVANGVTPDMFMARFNGTAVHETGTLWSPPLPPPYQPVDARAAYNAVNDPDLAGDVGWTPTLFIEVEPTQQMARPVLRNAGPFDW